MNRLLIASLLAMLTAGPAFAAGPAPLGLHVQVLPTPLEMQRVLGALAEALAAG